MKGPCKYWKLTERDTGRLQPHPQTFFPQKVEIFIPLEVYTYVVTQSYLQLQRSYKKLWTFLSVAILKVDFLKWLPLSWLLNLAPSTIIVVWRKILKLVCAATWTIPKITEHYVNL